MIDSNTPISEDACINSEVKEHILERNQSPPLRFKGQLIAEVTADKQVRGRPLQGVIIYRIYRTTGGNFVCEKRRFSDKCFPTGNVKVFNDEINVTDYFGWSSRTIDLFKQAHIDVCETVE